MDLQGVCYCLISPAMKRFRWAVWHWHWLGVQLALLWRYFTTLSSLQWLRGKKTPSCFSAMASKLTTPLFMTLLHPYAFSKCDAWITVVSCPLSETIAAWNGFLFRRWQSVPPCLTNNPQALSTYYPIQEYVCLCIPLLAFDKTVNGEYASRRPNPSTLRCWLESDTKRLVGVQWQMVLNKSRVVSFDWQHLSARSPWLLGLIDGLMVSTGEIGSWLLYLDKILDPSPSLFAVIARAVWTVGGKKGKVKAKSKGSASIHLTEWVNGNKWLSFNRPYIHLFSVTAVKDTGAYLCCTPALFKWKQIGG